MNTLTQQILQDLEQLPTSMQAEALDFVQFLKNKLKMHQAVSTQHNGKDIVGILQRMAARNALSEIKDPIAWQRETRKDRKLPGRES